jgi:hypothetical protein
MKLMAKVTGAVVILAVVIALLPLVASEAGEVVVVTTRDAAGPRTTRLWVVDYEGRQWLRGGPGSGWYERLQREPAIEVERAGVVRAYVAESVPERVATINALMAEKYRWSDRVVSVMTGDRSNAVAVRLDPAD